MRRLLLFALTLAVFGVRHLPGISDEAAEWISLATPFAVVAVLVPLGPRGLPLAVAVAGGILYVDGHGMHLAADSIRSEGLYGRAEDLAFFWDEQLSHWELHAGPILIVVSFCLAEAAARVPVAPDRWAAAGAALILGGTLLPAWSRTGTGGSCRSS